MVQQDFSHTEDMSDRMLAMQEALASRQLLQCGWQGQQILGVKGNFHIITVAWPAKYEHDDA